MTFRKGHRLRVVENRVLRRIFGTQWVEVTGKNYIMRSFITFAAFELGV
jgi:hypothetical protein